MIVIRAITLLCLKSNIKFSIHHIKGKFNTHANHLSHLQLDHFMAGVDDVELLHYWNPTHLA